MADRELSKALNRLADAQFQTAKAHQKHNRLVERQVIVSEAMLELQKVNLRVTQHLEAKLAEQTEASRHGFNS